jgi:hypothetical protein
MAADKGFLEDIGIGGADERAMAAAARSAQRDNFRALGMGARRGVGAIAGGVHHLVTGRTEGEETGRSLKGFFKNVAAGASTMEDMDAAQAAGIDLNTLYSRRAIRTELSKERFQKQEGEDDFDVRERMARRAAEIAQASGAPDLQAASLDTLTKLQEERMQFQKLEDEKRERDLSHLNDTIKTGYDRENGGNPLTGTLGFRIDEETGNKIHGLEYSNNGKLDFKAFSDTFSLEDPDAGTVKETADQRMRRAFGKGHVDETRSMVQANAQAMRKIERVTASVKSYVDEGIDEAVMGNSGRFVSWVDNGIRNIRGVIGSFIPMGREKGSAAAIDMKADPTGRLAGRNGEGYSGWNSWMGRASDAEDSLWSQFQLPVWAQGVSAEAQEHRAQILELAYMAARLAEPSNRGLSDKDIEAALARIAGDTSNPQQLLRRFVTIAADSAYDLEDRLDSYKSALKGIDDDEVDTYFGGKLLHNYRLRRDALFTNLGVEFDESHRAVFNEVVDTQFSPEGGLQTPEQTLSVEGLSEAESSAVIDDILGITPGGNE